MARIVVRTNWNGAATERHEFDLESLRDPRTRARLRAMWTDPEQWRPGVTRQALTEKAAAEFAGLAQRLQARGRLLGPRKTL